MLTNAYQNQILAQLSPLDFQLLSSQLEPVELGLRQRLEMPNRAISHHYFVENGIVSVVATGSRRRQTEVGLIGSEGVTGLSAILGVDRSFNDVFVQVAGDGYRIPTNVLLLAVAKSETLRGKLHAYVHVFMAQLSGTALANGHGKIEERLARWLLMARDRLASDEVPLTHEFLAMMLAVHRPGVTIALALLQRRGLLAIKRGGITITDRAGLEQFADKYYGGPEAEQQRLFGRSKRGAR